MVIRNPNLTFITSLKLDFVPEGPAKALFVWQTVKLLGENLDVLSECARCTHWFVAARPFQKYCAESCGRVIHNRTYQKKLRPTVRHKAATASAAAS